MTFTLVEGAVDAVRDRLEEHLNHKLIEVEGRWRGEQKVELGQVETESFRIAEPSQIPPTPAIFVLGQRSRMLNESQGYLSQRHALVIIASQEDPDPEILVKKLYRTILAVVETLLEARNTGAILFHWDSEYAQYSSIYLTDRAGQLAQDAQLYISVDRGEQG